MSKDAHLDGLILNIVQNSSISEQSELQNILQEKGYDVPQATLSRRLKKLKIAKVSGVYEIIEFQQPYLPIILNCQVSDFGLIVLHTHPGNAQGLAYFFDQKYVSYAAKEQKLSPILGTIAGDDTVMIIVRRQQDVEAVIALIQQDFPYVEAG